MKITAVVNMAKFPKSSGSKYLAKIGNRKNGINLLRILEPK